ncbi:hypothetical protein SY88_16765 [Clostridiales bacterium PH28_bin88]|nr:hypothetical protein SY88_16765 [Clostridiales bacterium PH28_bin88]
MTGTSRVLEIEQVIQQVRGVISAKVVAGDDGSIIEVHVLADATRSPKQVVRDVESAVLVQLGIHLDHKKISVAQIQGEEAAVLVPEARPQLGGIELSTSGIQAEAKVTVFFNGEPFEGKVLGPNVVKNRLRLVAMAALGAVEAFLGGTARFMLEDVQKVSFAGREVIMVGVSLVTPRGEDTLLGTAMSSGDDREAVARAALDAMNRRLALLKRD